MTCPEDQQAMPCPPEPAADWALFLDIDGTLIDLASSAESVMIPDELGGLLHNARGRLNGALALITGRTFFLIDMLPFTAGLACAAEHGAYLRDENGAIARLAPEDDGTIARLEALADAGLARMPGTRREKKSCGLTLHYRQAPEHAEGLRALAERLIEAGGGAFELLPAHMAFEIRYKGVSKGEALRALMARAPFAGRRPVFVGDDVTDEDAIEAARALGGIGLHVARDFGGRTAPVREWVARLAHMTVEN